MSKMEQKLQIMIEGAITAGLGVALGFIPNNFGPGAGFDLSFGLIPLGVFAIRRGLAPALVAGLVWALLKVIMGGAAYIMSPEQWILDYPVAFAAAGFMGVFSGRVITAIRSNNAVSLLTWMSASAAIGILARWTAHFIAGFLVWGVYAPEGQSPVIYSLILNGTSFIGNAIMAICVLTLLARWAPVVFLYGVSQKTQKQ
jgi:thiamine transporter